ncbi:MAG: hypothetical protein AVDCRST_MAG47-1474, partial [uncultured Nocardioidaceae bacterium]
DRHLPLPHPRAGLELRRDAHRHDEPRAPGVDGRARRVRGGGGEAGRQDRRWRGAAERQVRRHGEARRRRPGGRAGGVHRQRLRRLQRARHRLLPRGDRGRGAGQAHRRPGAQRRDRRVAQGHADAERL